MQPFGIPIRIRPSWFYIAAFIAWTLANDYFPSRYPGLNALFYGILGLAAAMLLFLCVLLHELGHSVVARHHGLPVDCVTLFLFGGVARIMGGPKRPAVELQVALAGPLVTAGIAWSCSLIGRTMTSHGLFSFVTLALLQYLVVVNIGLLCFNLLPGFPLDGGRVMRALLWAGSGNVRWATRVASTVGAVLGIALAGLGVWAFLHHAWFSGIWYVIMGLFLRKAALEQGQFA